MHMDFDWIHEYRGTDKYGNKIEPYFPKHPFSNKDTSFYVYPGITVYENVFTGNLETEVSFLDSSGNIIATDAQYWNIENDCTIQINPPYSYTWFGGVI